MLRTRRRPILDRAVRNPLLVLVGERLVHRSRVEKGSEARRNLHGRSRAVVEACSEVGAFGEDLGPERGDLGRVCTVERCVDMPVRTEIVSSMSSEDSERANSPSLEPRIAAEHLGFGQRLLVEADMTTALERDLLFGSKVTNGYDRSTEHPDHWLAGNGGVGAHQRLLALEALHDGCCCSMTVYAFRMWVEAFDESELRGRVESSLPADDEELVGVKSALEGLEGLVWLRMGARGQLLPSKAARER